MVGREGGQLDRRLREFGHDLLRAAKRFMAANGGTFGADELVPTDATDFSAYLLKIRNVKPDMVVSNLAGGKLPTLKKQYLVRLPFPVAGFAFGIRGGLGCRARPICRHWPLVWGHEVNTLSAPKFVVAFTKKYGETARQPGVGRLPVDEAPCASMAEIKSTDSTKVAQHMEKGAKFDVLKTREGYYRNWDHQLMQEMYTIKFQPAAEIKDKWNLFPMSPPVPAAIRASR